MAECGPEWVVADGSCRVRLKFIKDLPGCHAKGLTLPPGHGEPLKVQKVQRIGPRPIGNPGRAWEAILIADGGRERLLTRLRGQLMKPD